LKKQDDDCAGLIVSVGLATALTLVISHLYPWRPETLDVLSTRLALPLCPRFQTYCRLAANEVQGRILLNKSGGNPKRQADIFTASSVGCRNT
jgi:hypothetical protein